MSEKEYLAKYILEGLVVYSETETVYTPFNRINKAMLDTAIKEYIYLIVTDQQNTRVMPTDKLDLKYCPPVYANLFINNSILTGIINCFGYNITVKDFNMKRLKKGISPTEFETFLDFTFRQNLEALVPRDNTNDIKAGIQ